MGGKDHRPGPQSKGIVYPKNHLFSRHLKALDTDPQTYLYNLRTIQMHFIRRAKHYTLTGIALGVAVTSFAEWRDVLQYVPFINKEYEKPEWNTKM